MYRTLIIIKPDAVERKLTGKIFTEFERKGFNMVFPLFFHGTLTKEQVEEFYVEHKDKDFFPGLVEYMTSGPIDVAVIELANKDNCVIDESRSIIGSTDPKYADPKSIRGKFGINIPMNSIHGSDSFGNAAREIEFFFGKDAV